MGRSTLPWSGSDPHHRDRRRVQQDLPPTKALAAHDNGVALLRLQCPPTTIDWTNKRRLRDILSNSATGLKVSGFQVWAPTPDRDGAADAGRSPVANYAFDVTPARFGDGIVTSGGWRVNIAELLRCSAVR